MKKMPILLVIVNVIVSLIFAAMMLLATFGLAVIVRGKTPPAEIQFENEGLKYSIRDNRLYARDGMLNVEKYTKLLGELMKIGVLRCDDCIKEAVIFVEK